MRPLNEGIRNNSNIYDLYGEAGWLHFDKIKNYDEAVRYYTDAMDPSRSPNLNQVGHALAHSLERAGRIDDAIAQWENMVTAHQKVVNDPKAPPGEKATAQIGIQTATKNLNLMKIRKISREYDTSPPVDARFSARGVPAAQGLRGIENGTWSGPRTSTKRYGDRWTARAWMPAFRTTAIQCPRPLNFRSMWTRRSQSCRIRFPRAAASPSKKADCMSLSPAATLACGKISRACTPSTRRKKGDVPAGLGVPLGRALAGAALLSAEGRRALEALAEMPLADLRANTAKIAQMEKQGIMWP